MPNKIGIIWILSIFILLFPGVIYLRYRILLINGFNKKQALLKIFDPRTFGKMKSAPYSKAERMLLSGISFFTLVWIFFPKIYGFIIKN